MCKYVIELKGIDYVYPGGTSALRDVSMSFEVGKKLAILGSNGAGKSTLLFHLNGLLKPVGGLFFFRGERFSYSKGAIKELRRSVGVVFQDPDEQIFSSTVYEELIFGLYNLGFSRAMIEERISRVMEQVGLEHLRDRAVHNLSYGEKKRLCIASVLAMGPSVFVLDEPMVFLDDEHRGLVFNLLEEMNRGGSTIIFSTHDVDFAYDFADYIFVMDKGGVFAQGAVDTIFSDISLFSGGLVRKPFVLELYDELRQRGFLGYSDEEGFKYPITKDVLFGELRDSFMRDGLVK